MPPTLGCSWLFAFPHNSTDRLCLQSPNKAAHTVHLCISRARLAETALQSGASRAVQICVLPFFLFLYLVIFVMVLFCLLPVDCVLQASDLTTYACQHLWGSHCCSQYQSHLFLSLPYPSWLLSLLSHFWAFAVKGLANPEKDSFPSEV